jgi:hypothetical protein
MYSYFFDRTPFLLMLCLALFRGLVGFRAQQQPDLVQLHGHRKEKPDSGEFKKASRNENAFRKCVFEYSRLFNEAMAARTNDPQKKRRLIKASIFFMALSF